MEIDMSDEDAKIQHSRRRQKTDTHIVKQKHIAEAHGFKVDEPHRYNKHHAMDCGNPQCPLCGNPRRLYKERTYQEKRDFQNKLIE